MDRKQLNEENYWGPLERLAAETGMTLVRGRGTEKEIYSFDEHLARFMSNGECVGALVPVEKFSYYGGRISGYLISGKFMERREQQAYGATFRYNHSRRLKFEDAIEALRPALRSETPLETYVRLYCESRDRLTVKPKSSGAWDGNKATTLLLAMYRAGELPQHVLDAEGDTEWVGMDKPSHKIPVSAVLARLSHRVDLEIGNACLNEILLASYSAGLKTAGLKE
jgi:hypothetical protein